MKTIGFIGGGRVTRILLHAFKRADVHFNEIHVFDVNEAVLADLKSQFSLTTLSAGNLKPAASADLVMVALHPPVLIESLKSIKDFVKSSALVVSLAPKITITRIAETLPGLKNIARMNPNAGSFVNKGYNPICFHSETDPGLISEFISVFEKTGKVPIVSENLIEAYAVISAMGHTYFWFQFQQMKHLAIEFGMDENEAAKTITAMLWGTSETLFNSGLKYEEVIDLVPVKPLAAHEDAIRQIFKDNLTAIYQKIKP
jgi:pyrroline-5-carboxylate reductase